MLQLRPSNWCNGGNFKLQLHPMLFLSWITIPCRPTREWKYNSTILNLRTRIMLMVSFTNRPLRPPPSPPKRHTQTHWMGDWMGSKASQNGQNTVDTRKISSVPEIKSRSLDCPISGLVTIRTELSQLIETSNQE
jgi:hypothetical protein